MARAVSQWHAILVKKKQAIRPSPASVDQPTTGMGRPTKRRHTAQFPIFRDSVLRYFAVKENWDAVYPYVVRDRFSRRMYEHFVTDYARSHRCEYYLVDETDGERYLFNVYHSSQSVLHGCHKRHMDPFSRANKYAENDGIVRVGYGDKVCDITVSELNCFRWMHKRKVFEYMTEHEEEIKADMAAMAKLKRQGHAPDFGDVEEVVIVYDEPAAASSSSSSSSSVASSSSSSSASNASVYWQESTAAKKQLPPRKRKRYRDSSVNLVFNDHIEVESRFDNDMGGGGSMIDDQPPHASQSTVI